MGCTLYGVDMTSSKSKKLAQSIKGGHLITLTVHQRKEEAARITECCQNIDNMSDALDYAYSVGAETITGNTDIQRHKRICNEQWWIRQIPIIINRAEETLGGKLGIIKKHITNRSLKIQKDKEERNQIAMGQTYVLSETRAPVSLLTVARDSIKNRFARYLNHVDGMTNYADTIGHIAGMITLTCPSRMHPNSKRRYDGTSARSAQSYLSTVWATSRRLIQKEGIFLYGLRVAEPHKDSCPHWHLLVFGTARQLEYAYKTINRIGLQDSGRERGAKARRVKIDYIDRAKPATYLFKYLLKNIGLDKDSELVHAQEEIASKLHETKAWARLHGVRQMQMIGGVSVSIWDSLRALPVETSTDAKLEKFKLAAQSNDYAKVFQMQGGHEVKRSEHCLQTVRVHVKTNHYGEDVRETIGIRLGVDEFIPEREKVRVSKDYLTVHNARREHGLRNLYNDDLTQGIDLSESQFCDVEITVQFDDLGIVFEFNDSDSSDDLLFDEHIAEPIMETVGDFDIEMSEGYAPAGWRHF